MSSNLTLIDDVRLDEESEAAHRGEETASVIVTSLSAVATAWAAFQAATWSGRQAFAIAQGDRLRQLSTEAHLEGVQQMHLDAELFVAWTRADAEGNQAFAQFLLDRFPPRLRTATDAWLASRRSAPHPFATDAYRVPAQDRAASLGREADDAIHEGKLANRTSDLYVLATVVLATVMLLASLGTRLHHRGPRRAMFVVSVVGLVAVLAWLCTRPVAWAGV